MRNSIFILIFALFLGCGDTGRPDKPDNLISQDKMSEIMYDVFLMNAAKGYNKRILENNGILPEDFIYKKYQIDSLQFAQSSNYYSYDTKVYADIMEKVKQRIVKEKEHYDAINLKEEKTRDSLNEIKKKVKVLDTTINTQKLKLKELKQAKGLQKL